jgi:hypothetical protein
MECQHNYIDEGFCAECGQAMNINGYYLEHSQFDHNHAPKNIKNTFESDLQNIILPADIKEKIIALSENNTNINRKNVRKRILYSLAYSAYLMLGKSFDPIELATVFSLNSHDYTSAMKLVSGISNINSTNENISIVIINPISYFDDLITTLKQSASHVIVEKKDLEDIFNAIEQKCATSIFCYKPKHIAVAILKYYLDSKSIKIIKFHTYFDMTTSTINRHVDIIKNILNDKII